MANTRHRGGPKRQALPGRKCALLVKSPKFQQLAAGPGLEYCATARDCLIPQSIANHDGACREQKQTAYFRSHPWLCQRLPRRSEEDRIREAVFRDLIGSTVRWHVFLTIDGNDPSDKFMAQFADLKPAVKKAAEAECTIRGCFDRSTGERGVVLSVSSIHWSFGDRVEVEGGFHCGPLCGSGGVFEVMKNSGHWGVEWYRKHWDS
jgi:hypothetical protein